MIEDVPALRSRFEADGFVTLEDFVAEDRRAALRARAGEIVAAFDDASASVFTTHDDGAARDDYFLTSGDVVRCFWEEEARDERGVLRVPKMLAINKIGHALHDLDPVFRDFSHGPQLDAVVRALGITEPLVHQSMYIFKQPHIGGEVGWHQDATFFATEPQTVLTLWFALEPADRTNGCLWVQRGGHRRPLREQFVAEDGSARMVPLDDTPWPAPSLAEPLEVPGGALVVMHGLLPHYSAPNRSATSRHAYTLHVTDARAHYDSRNWLQRRSDFPARGFM